MWRFKDEFVLPNKILTTLILASHIIKRDVEYELINKKKQRSYRSRVEKIIYISR